MQLAYDGIIPIIPLVPQLGITIWCLVAPYLLLATALGPFFFWLYPIGLLALLWCNFDPVGRQIFPWRNANHEKTGVFGGSDSRLQARKLAVRRISQTHRPTPWLLSGDQRTVAVMASGQNVDDSLEVHHVKGCRGNLILYLRPGLHDSMVLVIGGIVGDPESPFIKHMQSATKDKELGFGLWVTRPDLLSGNLSEAPNPADVRDIHAILEWLELKRPGRPIYMVGYSMGASMVLLYSARYGEKAICTAAAAVSGSFTHTPLYCAHYRRYWQPWLTANLKVLFYKRFGHELPPKRSVSMASTYTQLIDALPHVGPTKKLCAESDIYAARENIRCPVLFFASADDPFHHPVSDLGIDESLQSVLYFITQTGGHVAWPEGWLADCSSFHTRVVLSFFLAEAEAN